MTSHARARRPRAARAARRAALTALLVLAPLAAAACGGGDDDASTGGEGGAKNLGAALADAAGDEATDAQPSGDDTDDTDDTASDDTASDDTASDAGTGDGGEAPELPAPTFPASSPPTTVEGMEAVSIPGANGDDPIFGQLVVDLEPGGYLDLPTHLRRGQHIQVLTSADDGIRSRTTVFAPDGSTVGQWESSGRRGDIEGYYWDDDDVLPADGTYVFRVEHLGGADNPFVLAFYGEE